jgi:hypothetical protein
VLGPTSESTNEGVVINNSIVYAGLLRDAFMITDRTVS